MEYQLRKTGIGSEGGRNFFLARSGRNLEYGPDIVHVLHDVFNGSPAQLKIDDKSHVSGTYKAVVGLIEEGHQLSLSGTHHQRTAGTEYTIKRVDPDESPAYLAQSSKNIHVRHDFMQVLGDVFKANQTTPVYIKADTLPAKYARVAQLAQRGHNARVLGGIEMIVSEEAEQVH